MKHRLPLLGLALTLVPAAGGTAYAFDCIRVSTSSKGVQQSAKSGNWLPFDFGSAEGTAATFADVFEFELTEAQAACIAAEYASTGQPQYFSLGIGVAGAKNESSERPGTGVLAWRNKNYTVLGDGHGIDHIENSPILSAVLGSAGACGVPIGEEQEH